MITGDFAGEYRSAFKGKGMEFEDVREYQPGDDIRFIDWNVTARTGHPYIKKFLQERELTVMFLLDVSASLIFGTVNRFKEGLAAELCSLLSLTAVKHNDRVGLILFTDRIEKVIPPGKGIRHAMRIVRDITYFTPEGRGTDIPQALDYLNKVSKRNTVAFIISDFHSQDLKTCLSVSSKRHDVIAVTVTDPCEFTMPDLGICRFRDGETGEIFLVDTSDPLQRKAYARNALETINKRNRLFNSVNIDHLHISTDRPYLQSLVKFFKTRERRLGRQPMRWKYRT